jgi:hypothetical protein
MTIAAVLAASQAAAFCDEGILETDVLCVTEDAEEIKLCRTVHPMTEMEILTLNVDPAISKGPHSEVARDIPFAMTLGTGGYPWDSYGLTFFDESGHAVLNLRRAIDAVDNSHVEISLDLFGRGSEPQRTLTCMVPALRAEIDALLTTRGVAPNGARTGPSADSRPFYIPRQRLPGDTPYGGYACREVGLVESKALTRVKLRFTPPPLRTPRSWGISAPTTPREPSNAGMKTVSAASSGPIGTSAAMTFRGPCSISTHVLSPAA